MPVTQSIPTERDVCFVNASAGSADEVVEALRAESFDVKAIEPEALRDALATEVQSGATRVIVAGGDGTLGTAASVLAGTSTALAIIPGGTLNHFAKVLGIPEKPAEAAGIARNGETASVDIGYVNDRLILNTSSVGVYVLFVRTRERLEKRLGYHLASALAALRIFWRLRTFSVELEVEGERRHYETPMVFVGIGERQLKAPNFGERLEGGARGLHVVVVRRKTRARLLVLGIATAARGAHVVMRARWLDSFVVDRCRIAFSRPDGNVAVDGEITPMTAPLEYRIERDALKVVVPESKAPNGAQRGSTDRA